jgi:hypothetical protein
LEPGASEIQTALTAGGPTPTTYLGWSNKINTKGSAIFASYFFENCNGGTTVADAGRAAESTTRSTYSLYWLSRPAMVFLGNSAITIDTTP